MGLGYLRVRLHKHAGLQRSEDLSLHNGRLGRNPCKVVRPGHVCHSERATNRCGPVLGRGHNGLDGQRQVNSALQIQRQRTSGWAHHYGRCCAGAKRAIYRRPSPRLGDAESPGVGLYMAIRQARRRVNAVLANKVSARLVPHDSYLPINCSCHDQMILHR